jgi:hypothetical protein
MTDLHVEFWEVDDTTLLHYALTKFEKFNRFSYCFKNNIDKIGWAIAHDFYLQTFKQLDGAPKKAKKFLGMLCIKDITNIYFVKYRPNNPKTRQKLGKVTQLLIEQIDAELSTLNQDSPRTVITATLIARELFRICLYLKKSLKTQTIAHIDGEIVEIRKEFVNNSKLDYEIKLVDDGGKFLTYSQIFEQTLKFTQECERLKLNLNYTTNFYIPISGLVNPKVVEEVDDWEDEYSKMWGYD